MAKSALLRLRDGVLDLGLAGLSLLAAPLLYAAARKRWSLRLTRKVHDMIGVTVLRNHYYEPVSWPIWSGSVSPMNWPALTTAR